MKFSFIMIVLNGMPFIKYSLASIYNFAHEIIIIEGAIKACMSVANPDGSSKDSTVELIKSFPDPENKVKLIQGKWFVKLEMQNRALREVTGDYIWIIDSDEVYKEEDLNKVQHLIHVDPRVIQINFICDNFWKGFDYLFFSSAFLKKRAHYRRVFKFEEKACFISHRPPTMFWPSLNSTVMEKRTIGGERTRAAHIIPFHYSYVFDEQVKQKIDLYIRYGWENLWNIDLKKWFEECFLKWTPQNRKEIESKWSVWAGGKGAYTQPFTGSHPKVMKEFIEHE